MEKIDIETHIRTSGLEAGVGVKPSAAVQLNTANVWTSRNLRRVALVMVLVGFAILQLDLTIAALSFAAHNLLLISPAVLIALFLTAGANATGSIDLIARSFQGHPVRMIGLASFVGALTPVCGITVYPLVAGLLAARVPLAPIMAFWLSSPITDPGMLAITAATLGWSFAIGKTAAAFLCGIVGGCVVLAFMQMGYFADPRRPDRPQNPGSSNVNDPNSCSTCDAPRDILWAFWRERSRVSVFWQGVRENGRLMLIWLTLALVAEYFMRLYVPDAWITSLVGQGADYAVPLAALIGAPIYLDGYAALPLLRGLMDSGMQPDAAMTFLVAGGITSAWAAIPVYSLVRLPVFGLYLLLAILCAMLSGWGFGLFIG